MVVTLGHKYRWHATTEFVSLTHISWHGISLIRVIQDTVIIRSYRHTCYLCYQSVLSHIV